MEITLEDVPNRYTHACMTPPESLFAGYKQVEAFGPEEDYETEEEVCYVTLDLGEIEPSLVPSSSAYRLIGLDTPTPYLQLQGTVFKGRHDSLLEDMVAPNQHYVPDNHDWSHRSVVHVANTEERIVFKEVSLIPKKTATESVNVDFLPQNEASTDTIDRLTGVVAPTSGKRRGRPAVGTGSKNKKTRGKDRDMVGEEVPIDPALLGNNDDDMDDMYVNE